MKEYNRGSSGHISTLCRGSCGACKRTGKPRYVHKVCHVHVSVNSVQIVNIIGAEILHTGATANRDGALVERYEVRVAGLEECSFPRKRGQKPGYSETKNV